MQALRWGHSRRKFLVLADVATSSADLGDCNGLSQRLKRRRKRSRKLVEELEDWMPTERARAIRSSIHDAAPSSKP